MNFKIFLAILGLGLLVSFSASLADEATIELDAVQDSGIGDPVGTVQATESEHGLILEFDIDGLTPGPHRFNIHAVPSCEPGETEGKTRAGGAAGPLWQKDGNTELNDFAVLYIQVDEDGALPYRRSIVAPGLSVADLQSRALVLHGHRDNYRYENKLADGRGPRVACGVLL